MMNAFARVWVALVLGCLALAPFAQAQWAPSILPSIFGPDDRVIPDTRLYPYTLLVELRISVIGGRGGVCTGALVGPDLILTAAHCFQGYLRTSLIYVTTPGGMRRGSAQGPFILADGVGYVDRLGRMEDDWAILRLPKSFGPSEWLPIDAEFTVGPRFSEPVMLAGYSGDRGNGLTVHEDCLIRHARTDGMLNHDCDMSGGSSGAPILHCPEPGRCSVIGINTTERVQLDGSNHFGRYSRYHPNEGIQARMFADTVKELLRTPPGASARLIAP